MRSNGLVAAAYAPIADLDPRVATSLLDDLAELGIAAYAKPVEPSTSVGFERSDFRVSVRDRLYVDVSASAQVRDLVAAQDQDLVYDNDDLAWAQLVAGFDQPLDTAVAPWPPQEDVDATPESAVEGDGAGSSEGFPFTDRRREHGWTGLSRRLPPADAAPPAYSETGDAEQEQEPQHRRRDDSQAESPGVVEQDHLFVPDPPPPLPKLAPYKQLAWMGLIGGPALLLFSALLGVLLPVWVMLPAVLGFIGGFVTLIVTMDQRNDGDWSSGNGAVV